MAALPTQRNNKVDGTQPGGTCPSSFDYENTNLSPMAQYVDTFNNMCISPVLANSGNYNIPLPSNIWPTETTAVPNLPFADAIISPTIPTDYVPVPLPSPFTGIFPITSNEWQIQMNSSAYGSPGTPWWLTTQSGIRNSNNLATPTTSLQTAMSNIRDPKAISLANKTTDPSQPESLPGSLLDGLARRASMSRAPRSSETATDFKSSALQTAVTSTNNIDPSQNPTSLVSNTGLPTPGVDNHTSPRRPASLRRTSSSNNTQQTTQPLSPTAQPKQRSRNRIAAHKYRAKSKNAVAALKAAERAESLRREELLATFRALQADVLALKSEILQHSNCGDWLIQDYLNSTARSLVTGCGGAAVWAPGGGSLIRDPTYM